MATIAAMIKWATNTEDLIQKLKSGEDAVFALQGAAEKTMRALGGEGLIRSANNAAAAVEKLGGASKLTGGESERLATLLDKAITKYQTMGQTAPSALQRLLDSTRANVDASRKLAEETAAVQRNVQAFSGAKIISEAGQMARAIEQVGGANKLTAGEMKSVNGVITEAIAKYRALGQEAPKALHDLEQQTRQLQPPTDSAGLSFGKLVASYVTGQAIIGAVKRGVGELKDFLVSSLSAYAQAEAAQNRLTTALRAQGQATPEVRRAYQDLSQEFQRTTVYGASLVTEMEALLVQVGNVMPSQMKSALTAATDLASGLGVDLRSATLLMGKAFEGETGTLKKYGVVIDEAKLKTQGITAVIDAIQAKFGGQAQAELDTYGGKIKQLANEWDDYKEHVGAAIANDPILNASFTLTRTNLHTIDTNAREAAEGMSTAQLAFIAIAGDPVMMGIRVLEEIANAYNATGEAARLLSQIKTPAILLNRPGWANGEWVKRDFITELGDARKELELLSPAMKAQILAAQQAGASMADLKEQFPFTEAALRLFTDATRLQTAADEKAARAAQQHAQEIRDLANEYSGATRIREAAKAIAAVNENLRDGYTIAMMTKDQQNALNDTVREAIRVEEARGRAVPPILRSIFKETFNLRGELEKIALIKIDYKKLLPTDLNGHTLADQIKLIPRNSLWSVWGLPDHIEGIENHIIQTKEEAKKTAEEIKHISTETHSWLDQLLGVGQEMEHIGSTIGGVIGRIVSAGGAIVSAWGAGRKAVQDYTAAVEKAKREHTNAPSQVGLNITGIGIATDMFMLGKGLVDMWADRHKAFLQAKADLISAHGGIHALRLEAQLAGLDLDRMWSGQSQAGLSRLEKALAAQKALMERYNLTWRDFPIGVRQANVDNSARTLITDYRALIQQGVGDDRAITGMSAALNQLVIDAVSTGTKIPVALQPILEKLIRMGGLTDDAARAMLGLGDDTMPTLEDITAAAGRYGLKLDELGPKVKQLSINAQAKQIVTDFDMLMRAGVPLEALMKNIPGGFREQVQGLVTDALTLGLTLPANLKPVLDTLLRAGGLTDQFGHKLTDLDGIKFEEPITQAIDRLIAKLQEWINKMSAVGTAADIMGNHVRGAHEQIDTAIPRPEDGAAPAPAPTPTYGLPGYPTAPQPGTAIPRPPTDSGYVPDPNTDMTGFAATGGYVGMTNILPFTGGGTVPEAPRYLSVGDMGRLINFIPKGTDTVPAMLTPGEVVLNEEQQQRVSRAIGSGGGNTTQISVRVDARGMIVDSRERVEQLAERVAAKVAASRPFAEAFERAATRNTNGVGDTIRKVAS